MHAAIHKIYTSIRVATRFVSHSKLVLHYKIWMCTLKFLFFICLTNDVAQTEIFLISSIA